MATNISGAGLVVNLQASETMPSGFDITEFADDADPLDIPSVQIGDKAMGLNGDLIVWNKAIALDVTINVIPGSEADKNLGVIFDANRVGRGRVSAQDEITMTAIYPDGRTAQWTGGVITDGAPADSVASAGRKKTKAFKFSFEDVTWS